MSQFLEALSDFENMKTLEWFEKTNKIKSKVLLSRLDIIDS